MSLASRVRPRRSTCVEYLRQHARDVAEGIVSGAVEPLEGARILRAVAGALCYPEDLEPWDGFDKDLFLVVGADGRSLYYSEDDMISIKRKVCAPCYTR